MFELRLRIGPASFRLLSAWKAPIDELRVLYSPYPMAQLPDFAFPDFTVRLEPVSWMRKYIRPSVRIEADFMLPDAAPLPINQALLAAEMGMNLQMALGWRRQLILHASAVEMGGRSIIMTGESGSGKSTMAALLGHGAKWRFMGDEFTLMSLDSHENVAFPRLISLKNQAIAQLQMAAPNGKFGPLMKDTPKGDICHLMPPIDAISRMDEPAIPALILFPSFGNAPEIRPMERAETFMRLTQASTNFVTLGEAGFDRLSMLVNDVPAFAIDYPDGETGMKMVEQLWQDVADG
ncbi:serine kinase [Sphingorhabdus lutea]|uniref:Serine kinase n=2 Tax=Sphingorhabdus lutea TaxID=1913578 RepID=A0A1L3JDS2_9SPHN|nr:serine kinase [Sphingorhabdus lutea]